MINLLLESAVFYVEKGWYVFPCRENPSIPFLKNGKLKILKEKTPYTRCGLNEATQDINQIKKWWTEHSTAMIGVNCGLSNIFVLDVDTKNGRNGIDTFMKLNIDDTGALHSMTPSGGLHIIFSGKGKTTTNPITGLDTRGIGGYIIAPPSKVLVGKTIGSYITIDDWERVPAQIPEKLFTKLSSICINKKTPKTINHILSHDENVLRAQKALEKLPKYMYDSYSDWVRIGMSLKSLEDDGLILWKNWSKQSLKYDECGCEEKWDSFDPKELTLGTLFYLASEKH